MSARVVPPLRGPIAVRAYTVRTQKKSKSRTRGKWKPAVAWPNRVLIFDTETSIDPSQRLLFGTYRYAEWAPNGVLSLIEEGVFYADELPDENPRGFGMLREYAVQHELRFLCRTEFVKQVFYPAASGERALIAGFNLPFDISRIAVNATEARKRYYGGFSFVLVEYVDSATGERRENPYYARVSVKHIDSKRAFIGFTGGREEHKGGPPPKDKHGNWKSAPFPGQFLDLKTLAFALTNEGYSLQKACEAFHVKHGKTDAGEHGRITPEYIDYNRRDVLASQELLEQLRVELDRHPIALDPCKAFSPASIAKAYLRALGVNPPLVQFPDVPPRLLGAAMSAYFGGRAEAHIRKCPVPVVVTDFLSMYPTVNANMGLWALLTAESLEIRDATADVRAQLANISLEQCFNRGSWPDFVYFALVRPSGDMLPVRAQYSDETNGWNIGVNPLTTPLDLWYAGPDLVASMLLTGHVPEVVQAFRIVPHGQQSSLQSCKLRGTIAIDPRKTDFFRAIVEMRKGLHRRTDLSEIEKARLDLFLKILANSGSYGVFAEVNREELPVEEREEVTLYGIDEMFLAPMDAPEEAGAFCFPPLAALITAGARLMLAMLERCVSDLGGHYAFCDTDSLAIVATERGGMLECSANAMQSNVDCSTIRALTWAQVGDIAEQFRALSPYDTTIIPESILKIEKINYSSNGQRELFAYVISAKRYALFTRDAAGTIVIEKPSEHGLGHLLNPMAGDIEGKKWIAELWRVLIVDEIGADATEVAWQRRPAIGRITISSPALGRAFAEDTRPYRERVKPFGFALSAHVAPFGHPPLADPYRFHLLAPYERDGRKWITLPWYDVYSGKQFAIHTGPSDGIHSVGVKSYGDVIAFYRTHPEAKSATMDGEPCGRGSIGLLRRRPVQATRRVYIGKESDKIEEVEQGLVHAWADVASTVEPANGLAPTFEWGNDSLVELSARSGLSARYLRAVKNGHKRPSTDAQRRIELAVAANRLAADPA